MAKMDLLIHAWDEAHREFGIALEGMPDEDLWKRPHPRLLSVGELAGHVIYWESKKGSDHLPEESRIKSPIIEDGFSYYTDEVDKPVTKNIGVAELWKEAQRVHEEAKKNVLALDPGYDDKVAPDSRIPWGFNVEYTAFHIAYHTGQIYSARHLLGHTTTDN